MVARSCVVHLASSCVLLEFAESVVRRSSVAVVETKRLITRVHSCVSFVPSADEALN